MRLEEVLSGKAGPQGLRSFLVSLATRKELRRALATIAATPKALGTCHLKHARFRLDPEARLSACFRLDIKREDAGEESPRAVFVIWKPRWIGKASAREPAPEVLKIEDEAARRGLAAPFRSLATGVPAWGMRLQISPLDTAFPQLVRLSDPAYVSSTVVASLALPRKDGRIRVTVVRYVPGQRHVLQYENSDAETRSTVFAKLYNDGKSTRLFELTRQAAEWLKAIEREIAVLAPLGFAPDDGAVFYPGLSGEPLHALMRRHDREVGRALELAGRALHRLHEMPPAIIGSLPAHSFDDELKDVREKTRYVSTLLPSAGQALERHLESVQELYAGLPQEPPTFTHGDVKAEHFWLTPEGLTLMDLDFCRRADPAFDLGQGLAELTLWDDVYGQGLAARAQEKFLAGYAPGVPQERLIRARLFESLELVKAAARRVPLPDRRWEERISRMMGCAFRRLDDLPRGSGRIPGMPGLNNSLRKEQLQMHVAMIGAGRVGLVAAACLADFGIKVHCVDVDAAKIESLRRLQVPFQEPGLGELVQKNVHAGRLTFSTNLAEAVTQSLVIFIAVGTEDESPGVPNLKYLFNAGHEIAQHMKEYKVLVIKSTVPVGTASRLKAELSTMTNVAFDVVSNPEFLREGSAIENFMRPDRVVLGGTSQQALAIVRDIYRPLYLIETPIVTTDNETAELAKYACNAFLATKISFVNEIANLCDATGVNVHDVVKVMGLDRRIGPKFLHPGVGFGGSCLPKDTRALIATAHQKGCELPVIEGAYKTNVTLCRYLLNRLKSQVGELSGQKVGILGLAYKPFTDDLRESRAVDFVRLLLEEGSVVQAYDPSTNGHAHHFLTHENLHYQSDAYDAANGAVAVAVLTEWNEFRNLDLQKLRRAMSGKVLLDTRNIFDPAMADLNDFVYIGRGRPARLTEGRIATEEETMSSAA